MLHMHYKILYVSELSYFSLLFMSVQKLVYLSWGVVLVTPFV